MLCLHATSSPSTRRAWRVQPLLALALTLVLYTPSFAQNGTVTGTVTNETTAAAVTSGSVVFCTASSCFGSTLNASGAYSASLAPGTYFAYTSVSGLVNEIFNNIQCTGFCNSTTARSTGTAITVAGSASITRDFALAPGGSISGTVTSDATGAPLVGVLVDAYTVVASVSTFAGSATTGANGTYSLGGLLTGTYYARTRGGAGINEIYDNQSCFGACSTNDTVTRGTPIAVVTGAATGGVSFALAPGGTAAGTVTDATTGAPLQGVNVSLYTRVGTSVTFMGSASTSASGTYLVPGLATGTYFALTTSSPGASHTNEIFNDILCPGQCSMNLAVDSGAPIDVVAGATTGGVNFALSPAARISGRVVNAQASAPIQGVNVSAYARIGLNVTFMGSATTNANGDYAVGGLPTGTYYLYTSTNLAINEIFNDLPCPGSCSSSDAVASGQSVATTQGTTTGGVNFQLESGGAISGTIVDAVTLLPLQAGVSIYRQSGSNVSFVQFGSSDASGVYTVAGLTTGTYFALVSPSTPYVREVFGGGQCFFCQSAEILAGTPIAVTLGATSAGRDFSVDLGGTITGRVTNAATGAPLTNASVWLPVSSNAVSSFGTDASGAFSISGLPPGVYRLGTFAGQFVNEAYDNIPCPPSNCSNAFISANGAPIAVSAGGTTSGINFALDPLSAPPGAAFNLTSSITATGIVISWSAPTSGGAATGYLLDGGVSPGTTAATLPSATTSLTLPLLPAGTYYIRIRATNAFGVGPSSSELALVVGAGGVVTPQPPTSPLAWTAGGRLTFTWSAPTTGPAPTDFVLEAGTAIGLSNIAVVPVSGRAFTFEGVPPGFYFLRVRSRVGGAVSTPTADVMINVGNVPAPPSPPQNLFHSRVGATVTFTWSAPAIGTATSYILEAGTAAGLSNITSFNTGSAAATFVVPGVPPGTYYVRVRAVNALGASPVSNERTVIVP